MIDIFEYKPEMGYFTNACLNMTDACPLACRYCFVAQQPHYMTLDTAKQCVDFLHSNVEKSGQKSGTLTFFGGEPMLCYDSIIVPLVEYAKEKYNKSIDFTITTNGVLLTEESLFFFKKNNIPILLSIDGNKETQDYNRPFHNGNSSFDEIIYKIPLILHYFPNTTFRATLLEDTVGNLFENYLFAERLGFRNIYFAPNCRDIWKEENLEILRNEIGKVYAYIACQIEEGKFPRLQFSTINDSFLWVLRKNIGATKNYRSPYRCGLGTTSASFSYDGKIYGCQEQDSYGPVSDFYIGDIDNGIDPARHAQLLARYANNEKMTCINKELCNGCQMDGLCEDSGCPSVCIDKCGSPVILPEMYCRWWQILYRYANGVIQCFQGNGANKTFDKFLLECCKYKNYYREEWL